MKKVCTASQGMIHKPSPLSSPLRLSKPVVRSLLVPALATLSPIIVERVKLCIVYVTIVVADSSLSANYRTPNNAWRRSCGGEYISEPPIAN